MPIVPNFSDDGKAVCAPHQPLVLKIKKIHQDAIVPQYQTAGAACFDLHALEAADAPEHTVSSVAFGALQPTYGVVERISLPPYTARTFRTGLAFEVPDGWMLQVYSRSGHGFKNSVRLANCVGIIDSDYRGELMIRLAADANGHLLVKKGDRIAQAVVMPIERITFELVDELSDTARGAGGFGSTGGAA